MNNHGVAVVTKSPSTDHAPPIGGAFGRSRPAPPAGCSGSLAGCLPAVTRFAAASPRWGACRSGGLASAAPPAPPAVAGSRPAGGPAGLFAPLRAASPSSGALAPRRVRARFALAARARCFGGCCRSVGAASLGSARWRVPVRRRSPLAPAGRLARRWVGPRRGPAALGAGAAARLLSLGRGVPRAAARGVPAQALRCARCFRTGWGRLAENKNAPIRKLVQMIALAISAGIGVYSTYDPPPLQVSKDTVAGKEVFARPRAAPKGRLSPYLDTIRGIYRQRASENRGFSSLL